MTVVPICGGLFLVATLCSVERLEEYIFSITYCPVLETLSQRPSSLVSCAVVGLMGYQGDHLWVHTSGFACQPSVKLTRLLHAPPVHVARPLTGHHHHAGLTTSNAVAHFVACQATRFPRKFLTNHIVCSLRPGKGFSGPSAPHGVSPLAFIPNVLCEQANHVLHTGLSTFEVSLD